MCNESSACKHACIDCCLQSCQPICHYCVCTHSTLLLIILILCDSVCLEQWIRAKYERKEFASESDMSKTPYTAGAYACIIMCTCVCCLATIEVSWFNIHPSMHLLINDDTLCVCVCVRAHACVHVHVHVYTLKLLSILGNID